MGFVKSQRYLEAAELARMACSERPGLWDGLFQPFDTKGVTTTAWNTIAKIGVPKIVTTNWDNCGGEAFAKVWRSQASTYVGMERALIPIDEVLPHVIQIHGQATNVDSLIFTRSSYDAVEVDDRYREFWIDLLIRRPLLIFGFSGEDPAFQRVRRYISEKLKLGSKVRPFVVLPKSRSAESFGDSSRLLLYDDSSGAWSRTRDPEKDRRSCGGGSCNKQDGAKSIHSRRYSGDSLCRPRNSLGCPNWTRLQGTLRNRFLCVSHAPRRRAWSQGCRSRR